MLAHPSGTKKAGERSTPIMGSAMFVLVGLFLSGGIWLSAGQENKPAHNEATGTAQGTKDATAQKPGPKIPSEFSGRVTDQQGKAIPKARVEVNGKEVVSKDDGTFQLPVAAAKQYILNISHADFADASHLSRVPLVGQTWRLVRAQIETMDPKVAITLQDRRAELKKKKIGGVTFSLPANSLVDDKGKAPAGKVRSAIATLDVANGDGPGDWAVRSDDGKLDGYLVSYGAAFIQFTDPTGNVRYQLRTGTAALVSLPVIPSMLKHAPDTPQARFWYYDTRDGYWKHTGTAEFNRVAGAYTGKVDHLSTINTDIAKFENAACLKITLDPSVALGLKLRIRYHSGGTAFGQSPTFVMNDTINAAYRLPANTNVLLELLDAGDAVFGDLVVESPPGSTTVNNVVNTGPPIPAGHTLWPPPPYDDCKPVLLRRKLPQVEIRINELPADPALKDNPSDDYVTWAPTYCRARLVTPLGSAVNVVLTNDPPGAVVGGGDVVFGAHQDPWPANTTATADTLALTLPGDGSWKPFVIAGKFGSPSTNDKDAIIEVHQNTAAGTLLGTKALMVRVRKNANTLTPSERSRFLFALKNLRNRSTNSYLMFEELHRLASTAGNQAHRQPAFLPWHRAMLLHVEREIQKSDPSVSLHYWDWDAVAPNVFSAEFMGAPGNDPMGSFLQKPVFALGNPLNGWNTDLPFGGGELRRNINDHTVLPSLALPFKPLDKFGSPSLVDRSNYGPRSASDSFSTEVEHFSHDLAHGWPCGGGHLATPNRSAAEPLFYLLHSNIERQWAYWQQKKNRLGVIAGGNLTFPAPAHYDNNGNWNDPGVTTWLKGSFLEDGMWPWDATSGPGGAGVRSDRPKNQADGSDFINEATSHPLVPQALFPASPRLNLWPPAAAAVPKARTVIDYLGRFRPQDGLGFCYDDVPYQTP